VRRRRPKRSEKDVKGVSAAAVWYWSTASVVDAVPSRLEIYPARAIARRRGRSYDVKSSQSARGTEAPGCERGGNDMTY